MKKLLLAGAALLSFLCCVNAQSPYGIQVGLTYYDLPSNASCPNRIVYNEDDQSVSVTWIQSITALAQPTFERGAGYNHFTGGDWQYGYDGLDSKGDPKYLGECRINNGCSKEYSGWPELVNFPRQSVTVGSNTYTDVTKEMIIAHSGGLKNTYRYHRGVASWLSTQKLLFDQDFCQPTTQGLWPRVVSDGDKYLHMIAINRLNDFVPGDVSRCGTFSNVDQPFLYYRSSDMGENWDIKNFVLPGMEDTTFFKRGSGDGYAIAARNNVVAIVAGGFDQPWVMWKSLDNGISWDYTIIRDWDSKVIDVEGTFNTGEYMKQVSDGHHALVIDDNGNVHCFTGVVIGAVDPVTGEYGGMSTFGNSGIWYWNDGLQGFCEPEFVAHVVDLYDAAGNKHPNPIYSDQPNYDPFDYMAQTDAGYFASSTSMPNASVDANGNIYLVYSSDMEGTFYNGANVSDPASIPFRDNYMVWSNDGGTTWSREINIAGEIAAVDDGSGGTGIEEDVYPSVAHFVGSDRTLHIIWNMDYKPGSDIQDETNEFSQQYVTYYGIPLDNLVMEAKTVVSLNPNTITPIQDTIINSGDVFEVAVPEGYYSVLSPVSLFNDTLYDTVWCVECDSSIIASVDSIWCSGCGPGGIDTFVGLDTVYTDTVVSTTPVITDLNNDGDSLWYFGCANAGTYTLTVVYGNACPDPQETFHVFCADGDVTASILANDTLYMCAGDSMLLQGLANGGDGSYVFNWSDDAGSLSATMEATISPDSNTSIIFTVDDQAGGISADTIVVVINENPIADAGPDFNLIMDLNNCSPFAIIGPSSVNSAVSYAWVPQVGMSSPNDASESNPVVIPTETTTYTLTVTDNNGCASSDDVIVNFTSVSSCVLEIYIFDGVSDEMDSEANISIFPNPATNSVNVEMPDATINTISIFNALGEKVYGEWLNNKSYVSVDLESYQSGIYFVQLNSSKGVFTRQLMLIK